MNTIIGITMGDPKGVGPEIILKTFERKKIWEKGIPIVIGDYTILSIVRERLGINVDIVKVKDPSHALNLKGVLPVLDMNIVKDPRDFNPGEVSKIGGYAAVSYIEKGVSLAMDKKIKGLATAPINKEALNKAGYHYIGHTEMLSEMSKSRFSLTMFSVDKLKIFFHTRHLSLREAIETLTIHGVVESIILSHKGLRSIGYERPHIGLSALNPHASDGGLFGNEEDQILRPACERAQKMGIDVVGPIPADSIFYFALQGRYDGVLSLYHDQGHIASKTYDFYRTISVTLGLPFLRTSVDHGTAFDIAWKGIANPVSMEEAILSCFELSERYRPFTDLNL